MCVGDSFPLTKGVFFFFFGILTDRSKSRSEFFHHIKAPVHKCLLVGWVRPAAVLGAVWSILHKQGCHMVAGIRSQRHIQRRGDRHLDDGSLRAEPHGRVPVRLFNLRWHHHCKQRIRQLLPPHVMPIPSMHTLRNKYSLMLTKSPLQKQQDEESKAEPQMCEQKWYRNGGQVCSPRESIR